MRKKNNQDCLIANRKNIFNLLSKTQEECGKNMIIQFYYILILTWKPTLLFFMLKVFQKGEKQTAGSNLFENTETYDSQ